MTDPVDLALNGFKAVISSLAPSGKPALNAAYVYPNESDSWRQTFEAADLPIGIISQAVGETNVWESLAAGQLSHKWQIIFRLLLRRGKINDTELAYEVAQLHNDYIRATAVLLAANSTLNGTISLLGEGRRGKLMESTIGHLEWLNQEYWGVYFLVPIQQVLTTPTNA